MTPTEEHPMRVVNHSAELEAVDTRGTVKPPPGAWFVTHPLGKPAAGTYTEVAFTQTVLDQQHPPEVLEQVVRDVAAELYGNAWAFHYRPADYEQAIERYAMRRRERVVVTAIEWYDVPPRTDRPGYTPQLDVPQRRGTDLPQPTDREDQQ
jgi:hypothetical protein